MMRANNSAKHLQSKSHSGEGKWMDRVLKSPTCYTHPVHHAHFVSP